MSIANDKIVNLQDAKVLYDDLRGRIGNAGNAYYGTSETAGSTRLKVCVVENIESVEEGNVFFITFDEGQTYSGNPQLQIQDGSGTVLLQSGTVSNVYYGMWKNGETVPFVWNGAEFKMVLGGTADFNFFGRTRLTNSITSRTASDAVTPVGIESMVNGIVSNALPYDTTTSYAVGDRCVNMYDVYECIEPTQGAWTPAKWKKLDTLQEQIDDTNTYEKTISEASAIQSFEGGAWPMKMQIAIEPVQEGSGDPSPSNVRPITGWTGANVRVSGKNLLHTTVQELEKANSNWTLNGNTFTRSDISITIEDDGTFSVSGTATGTVSFFFRRMSSEGDLYGPLVLSMNGNITTNGDAGICATYVDETGQPARALTNATNAFEFQKENLGQAWIAVSKNVTVSASHIGLQLEFGETATEFEPHAGATYPITFPVSAGTVYGGTLTVNADGTGELVVDMAIVTLTDLSQLSAYATDATNGSYARITGTAGERTPSEPCVISSNSVGIAYDDRNAKFSDVDRVFLNNSGYVTIRASKNRSISSVEDLFSLFNGGQFVYKIEPTVTTLSTGQVKSLLGQNHVWADTGNILSLTYNSKQGLEFIREDTAGQIAEANTVLKAIIAPELDGMVADTALSVNDFRIVGGVLYIVTAPIASGGTLTVGTNVSKTSIGEQITALLNAN